LAMAFDIAAIAMAEIGNVSERRLELLLNPHFSGLPAFLAPKQGLNSGYMAAQYLSASLVNENKLLANPSCTDSIPGNVGIEDHVSMGMTSARKFKKLIGNVRVILAVEMMVAVQGIDLRGAKKLGKGTRGLYKQVRKDLPKLMKDRIISEDIQKAVNILIR
ncbi:MAG: aromatic amino acid lyase, partial [Waddliaceae bacterium]